jgi:hypothetical protein
MNNARVRKMEQDILRNLEFKTEYLPKLQERVSKNNRFEVINKQPVRNKPRVRVQFKTNTAEKMAAKAAKSNGYRTTNLKIKNAKAQHTVYKKLDNNHYYVKFVSKNYQKLPLNMILKKPNRSEISVGKLINNYNYTNNINLGTYINIVPVNARSVYLDYGHTTHVKREMGYGTLLRKFAMNAAKNAKMKLYQVSMNIDSLVPQHNVNRTPYSGRIMKKLGAQRISVNNIPESLRQGYSNKNFWFVYPA